MCHEPQLHLHKYLLADQIRYIRSRDAEWPQTGLQFSLVSEQVRARDCVYLRVSTLRV